MTLKAGTTLGNYEIVALLGAGGMGEVYRARDLQLGRHIALKVLPDAFSRDHERVARFEREATLLASLNHPGIATLHSFEKSESHFLVMELVEGETLEQRIARGPLPLDEAAALFLQIAEALEAAHDNGIIHRDLKPANINVTPDGRTKILDFGLAKGLGDDPARVISSESPTATRGTAVGVILGTEPYMSPEQARGKILDKRADIWAFGCVLYEALTGKKTFGGDTVADVLGGIVNSEPEWDSLPKTTPRKIRELLLRCLCKDPRRRLRDIGEAWIALDGTAAVDAELDTGSPKHTFLVLAAVAVVAACIAVWSLTRPKDSPRRISRTELSLPSGTELAGGGEAPSVAISPNGRHVSFTVSRDGTRELYLRSIDEIEPILVDKGTRGYMPFFSADSEWLGFLRDGRLNKVPLSGGAAVEIASVSPVTRGASWGSDGAIVVNRFAEGLSRVSEDGGALETLTSIDRERGEKGHRLPESLPGDKAVLFTMSRFDFESYDDAPIAALSLETGAVSTVVTGGTNPRYTPSGHLVFARAGSLLALPFDAKKLHVTGTPVSVLDDVSTFPANGSAEFDVAQDGTLVYAPGGPREVNYRLVWVDRNGRSQPVLDTLRVYYDPRISPDGQSVALTVDTASGSVYVYDLNRGSMTRVLGFDSTSPAWLSTQRLVFQSKWLPGPINLYESSSDGSGDAEQLSPSTSVQLFPSVSPDGASVVFQSLRDGSNADLLWISLTGARSSQLFLQTEFNERNPQFSPDGRFVAYESDESGRNEIYVRTFPASTAVWPASKGPGTTPRWHPDGTELFFRQADSMMAVSVVEEDGEIRVGKPTLLFQWSWVGRGYDVAADGRFIMMAPGAEDRPPDRLILVQNWSEELKRLVPTN